MSFLRLRALVTAFVRLGVLVWLQKSFHFRVQVRTLSQLVVHVLDSIICLHPRVCLEQLLDLWEHLFSIVVEVTIADYRDHDAIEFTKLLQ